MNIKLLNKGTEGEALLEGSMDSVTTPQAETMLMELVPRFEKLTLNLASLEYISSRGLRTLKVLHIAMKKKGGKLVLKNVSASVMEIFEITGFAGMLQFE